jgi:hypothetical protein
MKRRGNSSPSRRKGLTLKKYLLCNHPAVGSEMKGQNYITDTGFTL